MTTTDYNIDYIENYLKENLSFYRYRHSVSTAETARNLSTLFGYDSAKGFKAGLLHDIAREYKTEEIISLSASEGKKPDEYELNYPVILHGRAGAVLIKKLFNIQDPEIIEAVEVHTTGRPGMGTLSKIVFIADYIEPYRKHITDEYLYKLKNKSLDIMLETVLISIIDYMKKKYEKTSESTIKLLEELNG